MTRTVYCVLQIQLFKINFVFLFCALEMIQLGLDKSCKQLYLETLETTSSMVKRFFFVLTEVL